MKLKITSQKTNPLLKRKEVTFEIENQNQSGTPTRLEVRKTLAAELATEIDNVYVKKIETKKGTTLTVGTATVYENVQYAKLAEPAYIAERNTPKEKKTEEATTAKPANEAQEKKEQMEQKEEKKT